jgi:hypothetical protein
MTTQRMAFVLGAAIVASFPSVDDSPPEGIQPTGLYQYTVTAPSDQLFAKADEACAKVGRTVSSLAMPAADNFGNHLPWHAKVECFKPYEVVPLDKDLYKIAVSTQQMPLTNFTIPATNDVPSRVVRVPDSGPADKKVMQLATEYCGKMHKAMKVTDTGFDMGTGLYLIFSCVPPR